MAFPPLDGVGLRYLQESDVPVFVEWERWGRPYPWTALHFSETMASEVSRTLVIEKEGRAAGYAAVQVIGEEAYLLNIVSDPAHRRQGIGERLLQKVMIWARLAGAREIRLEVDPANVAAIGLYEKVGFDTQGRRAHAYPNGESADVMRREL